MCQRKIKRCNSELWNVGKISTKQKNTNSDVCLACEKKFAVRPFTVKATYLRKQSKSNYLKLKS